MMSQWIAYVLTDADHLWVLKENAHDYPGAAAVAATGAPPPPGLLAHPALARTRVTVLLSGEPVPRFVRLDVHRRSFRLPERLLAPVPSDPRRQPALRLLAVPQPLALFADGRVWSVWAARPLARTDVVSIKADRPRRAGPQHTGLVVLRRRDDRYLVVDPEALWAATSDCPD